MGRGRAKAKQTKVARELKYFSPDTDLSKLERELHGSTYSRRSRSPTTLTTTSTTSTARGLRRGRRSRPAGPCSADHRTPRRRGLPSPELGPHGGGVPVRVPRDRSWTGVCRAWTGQAGCVQTGHPRRHPDPCADLPAATSRRRPRPQTQASHAVAGRAVATAASASSAGTSATMPDAAVQGALEVGAGDPAEPAHEVEDRRRGPGRRGRRPRAVPRGQHPGQVGGQAAAGDVRDRVDVGRRAGQVEAGLGVDPGGLQQLLAEGAAELVDVAVQRPARPASRARGAPASSRWSAARWTPSRRRRRPARPGPGRAGRSASTTPVVAPAHVVLVRAEQPGVLGRLAADQGAAGLRRSASAMPLTIAAIRSGTTWPVAM